MQGRVQSAISFVALSISPLGAAAGAAADVCDSTMDESAWSVAGGLVRPVGTIIMALMARRHGRLVGPVGPVGPVGAVIIGQRPPVRDRLVGVQLAPGPGFPGGVAGGPGG